MSRAPPGACPLLRGGGPAWQARPRVGGKEACAHCGAWRCHGWPGSEPVLSACPRLEFPHLWGGQVKRLELPACGSGACGKHVVVGEAACLCCARRWGTACRVLGFTTHSCPVNVDREGSGLSWCESHQERGPAARSALRPTRTSPGLWGRHGRATEFPLLSSGGAAGSLGGSLPHPSRWGSATWCRSIWAARSGHLPRQGAPGAAPLSPLVCESPEPEETPPFAVVLWCTSCGDGGPCVGFSRGRGTSGLSAVPVGCWSEGAGAWREQGVFRTTTPRPHHR